MIEHGREGNVHVVTLGDDANLLHPALVARLHEVLDAVDAASDGPSALVLTARGKFFSSGLDVAQPAKPPPDAIAAAGADAKAPADRPVGAALDIVRPLAEKDRGIYRSPKRTLRADLGRAFGLDL